MKQLFFTILTIALTATWVTAAARKAMKDVDPDVFITDTQVSPAGAGDDHFAMVWWIPSEFWESVYARDMELTEADKKAVLDALDGVSLVGIVQADIGRLGDFHFYSKEKVARQMNLSYEDAAGKTHPIEQMKSIRQDLEIVLASIKPILSAAMGNFGDNFHFFVLNDANDEGSRVIDPYQQGVINVELVKRGGHRMNAQIEMPLNSLFVPRVCPNGREAHVSWKFCPWTGEKLPE